MASGEIAFMLAAIIIGTHSVFIIRRQSRNHIAERQKLWNEKDSLCDLKDAWRNAAINERAFHLAKSEGTHAAKAWRNFARYTPPEDVLEEAFDTEHRPVDHESRETP